MPKQVKLVVVLYSNSHWKRQRSIIVHLPRGAGTGAGSSVFSRLFAWCCTAPARGLGPTPSQSVRCRVLRPLWHIHRSKVAALHNTALLYGNQDLVPCWRTTCYTYCKCIFSSVVFLTIPTAPPTAHPAPPCWRSCAGRNPQRNTIDIRTRYRNTSASGLSLSAPVVIS